MPIRSLTSRRLPLLAAGTAMAAAALGLPLSTADAAPRSVSCSALIEYANAGGVVSSYAQEFKVAPGKPFSDDRSTPTRTETFDASLNPRTFAVDISYFKDVSVFDSIDLRTSVNRRAGVATGTSNLINSSSGQHLTGYTITCR